MKKIYFKIKFWIFKILHKTYEVRYRTYGSSVHTEYIAMYRWEKYELDEIIKMIADAIRVKPSKIKISSVRRIEVE